jgi:hypothetical protein
LTECATDKGNAHQIKSAKELQDHQKMKITIMTKQSRAQNVQFLAIETSQSQTTSAMEKEHV